MTRPSRFHRGSATAPIERDANVELQFSRDAIVVEILRRYVFRGSSTCLASKERFQFALAESRRSHEFARRFRNWREFSTDFLRERTQQRDDALFQKSRNEPSDFSGIESSQTFDRRDDRNAVVLFARMKSVFESEAFGVVKRDFVRKTFNRFLVEVVGGAEVGKRREERPSFLRRGVLVPFF